MNRKIIFVKGGMGFSDGDYAIGIMSIATGQTTVPPLAFETREQAQSVVDAIIAANPTAYMDVRPLEVS